MIRSRRAAFSPFVALIIIGACASPEKVDDAPRPPLAPEGGCSQRCAEDGHAILDCKGEVVATCAAYSSCFDAQCIPGCEAATRGQSTVGCEYFAAKPSANRLDGAAAFTEANCYAVLVANTWVAPIELNVEYDGKQLDSSYFRIPRGKGKDIRYELLPEGKLPRDELAVLFLAMHPKPTEDPHGSETYVPCPAEVGAAVVGPTSVRGSGIGKMFHIRSSAPVIAYDIYPYGGAGTYLPSSSLLLPTSAWGTENIAMDGYSMTNENMIRQGFHPYFQILASENDTRVKIKPTTTLASAAGRPPLEKGTTGEYTLQRGEFLQFTQVLEVNGTGVESDKPVSLVGGATCMYIPNALGYCDTLHQHLPPIRLFGDTYVATRYRDRIEPERTPWRILSAAAGTKLTFDPPIADAPTALERGEWKEIWTDHPFVVKSQDANHPIYVAAYMTGSDNTSGSEGDPEMVNVVPVGQYLSSYVFLTDPTYANTDLVFVRGAVDGKYEDVQLDCAGKIQNWTRIGGGGYEVAHVDLVKRGIPQGACDNGVHRASSNAPFALTVWGWDVDASYGFPAGMGTKILNEIPAIR